MTRARWIGLDGLRGVAAMAVVFDHARVPGLRFMHGHLAVDLFFLLSGMVIAKSYEPQLANGRLSLRGYALVRLERLYPLLFIGSVIGLALFATGLTAVVLPGRAGLARAIIAQFMLIPFLAGSDFYVFNRVHWSVTLELVANALHAVALRWLSLRVLGVIVGGSALLLGLAAGHYGSLDLGWNTRHAAWGLARLGFGFFGGVLIYRTRDHWQHRVPALPFGLLAALLLVLTGLPEAATGRGLACGIFEWVVVVALFPPLVMAASVVRFGARGEMIAAALGTLSFPLYAVHLPVIDVLRTAHASAPAMIAAIGGLIIASWALGHWVDEPLNAWRRRRRYAARLRPAPAAPL